MTQAKHEIPLHEYRRRVEAMMQTMRDKIAKHGYTMLGVFPHPEDVDHEESFAYTIGLSVDPDFMAELLCVGIPQHAIEAVFPKVIEIVRMQPGKLPGILARGDDIEFPLAVNKHAPFGLRVIKEQIASEYIIKAAEIYGKDTLPCVQLVMPDNELKLPWHEGFVRMEGDPQTHLWTK